MTTGEPGSADSENCVIEDVLADIDDRLSDSEGSHTTTRDDSGDGDGDDDGEIVVVPRSDLCSWQQQLQRVSGRSVTGAETSGSGDESGMCVSAALFEMLAAFHDLDAQLTGGATRSGVSPETVVDRVRDAYSFDAAAEALSTAGYAPRGETPEEFALTPLVAAGDEAAQRSQDGESE